MPDMLRHVAKIANTDQRCVVAFMQIPGREDHALVIPVDNLPPRMEQAVMDVLNTPEGQNEETFAVALSRRLLPDNGQNILEALHKTGRLTAVPTEQVLMMPRPNQPIKLSSILEKLNRLPNQEGMGIMEDYAKTKFNPHLANQQANVNEQNRNIARNLLIGAEMMEADAKRKRDEAYTYDPSLRPMTATAPIAPIAPPYESTPNEIAVEQNPPELVAMIVQLMERVEAQDKVLAELLSQTTSDVHELPVKRRRRQV